jgi:hypothetical protein
VLSNGCTNPENEEEEDHHSLKKKELFMSIDDKPDYLPTYTVERAPRCLQCRAKLGEEFR